MVCLVSLFLSTWAEISSDKSSPNFSGRLALLLGFSSLLGLPSELRWSSLFGVLIALTSTLGAGLKGC